MLNKKREKSKNKKKEEKNTEKSLKDKKNIMNNNKINNKNILYILKKNQNYSIDGYGKLKLIEGKFDILGYSLSDNEVIVSFSVTITLSAGIFKSYTTPFIFFLNLAVFVAILIHSF